MRRRPSCSRPCGGVMYRVRAAALDSLTMAGTCAPRQNIAARRTGAAWRSTLSEKAGSVATFALDLANQA